MTSQQRKDFTKSIENVESWVDMIEHSVEATLDSISELAARSMNTTRFQSARTKIGDIFS